MYGTKWECASFYNTEVNQVECCENTSFMASCESWAAPSIDAIHSVGESSTRSNARVVALESFLKYKCLLTTFFSVRLIHTEHSVLPFCLHVDCNKELWNWMFSFIYNFHSVTPNVSWIFQLVSNFGVFLVEIRRYVFVWLHETIGYRMKKDQTDVYQRQKLKWRD